MVEEKNLYICVFRASSPNKQISSRDIDDTDRLIRFAYTKDVRREISRIRAHITLVQRTYTIPFYGIYIAREDVLPTIREKMEFIDGEFKRIDPLLYANCDFIPLAREIRENEVYTRLSQAVYTVIFGGLFERIAKLIEKGELPKKSKKSLLNLLESLKSVNLFDDIEINNKINEFIEKISNDNLNGVFEELQRIVKEKQIDYSFIEIDEENEKENKTGVIEENQTKETTTDFHFIEA